MFLAFYNESIVIMSQKGNGISAIILKEINELTLKSGEHQLTLTDTSGAWKIFKNLYNEKSDEVDESQIKSSALKSFQNILEKDVDNKHKCTALLPEHAQYGYIFYEKKQSLCDLCHQSTENAFDRHACRICDRTFHAGCLKNRGFCDDDLSSEALDESTSALGWSCPSCEGLFSLLEENEQEEIIELFTNVSGDDGVIDREEFLQLQKDEYFKLIGMTLPLFREKQELELFSKIDRDHTGTIDYWEFLPHMAVRFLNRRSSLEIVKLLNPKEISAFKEFFKQMDQNNIGAISQSFAKQAYLNWYKSKVQQCGKNYIDFEWYGGLKENPLLQALKKSLGTIDEEENESLSIIVEWNDYLKQCALHLLSARANTVSQKPLIPPMPIVLYATGDNGEESSNDDFLRLCDEANKWTNYLERKGFKY